MKRGREGERERGEGREGWEFKRRRRERGAVERKNLKGTRFFSREKEKKEISK